MPNYVKKKPLGLFDYQDYTEDLSSDPTSLDKLNDRIEWEFFRENLEETLNYSDGKKGGRPPFDPVIMFKVVVLQRYFNLSEEETEFQIKDRFSFQRFLDLTISDKMPDKNTIWTFKEKLGKDGVESLFLKFEHFLFTNGITANRGKIVDASFVEVPRQRNNRDENKQIKNGETPPGWKGNSNKMCQKDIDARWTKKNNETHYGYKNHVKIDNKTKLIENYAVTDASVHDSQVFIKLLDKNKDGTVWADSAYRSKDISEQLSSIGIKNMVHEKGVRGRPLTEAQKKRNTSKSRIRVRVEHIFGFIHNSMNGGWIRTIGADRAERGVGVTNLVYNMFRFTQLNWTMN
jgi:transposase, IS5 family